MKPKFLLTILTFNALFLGTSIATASSIAPEHNIPKLSHSISKLVGLEATDSPIVAMAIDRAIASKKTATTDKEKVKNLPHLEPALMGKVAVPKESQKPARTPRKKDNKNIDR
jgi:hypothetical protein